MTIRQNSGCQPGDRILVRLSGRVQRLEVVKANRLTVWVRCEDGQIVKRKLRRDLREARRV